MRWRYCLPVHLMLWWAISKTQRLQLQPQPLPLPGSRHKNNTTTKEPTLHTLPAFGMNAFYTSTSSSSVIWKVERVTVRHKHLMVGSYGRRRVNINILTRADRRRWLTTEGNQRRPYLEAGCFLFFFLVVTFLNSISKKQMCRDSAPPPSPQ